MNESPLQKVGYFSFSASLFLLPSALFFGAILLLFSACIGCFNCEQNYFKCNWNKTFFVCGLLILSSRITHSLFLNHSYKDLLNANLSLIGTLNWLPFFWLFWGFQPYLNSKHKRKRKAEGGLESTPYDSYYKLFASPFSIAYNNKEDTRLKTAADMGLAGTIKRSLSQIQEINGQYYIAPTIDFNTGELIEGQAVINQLNSFIDEGVVRGYDSKRTANKQARLLIENLIQEQRKQ